MIIAHKRLQNAVVLAYTEVLGGYMPRYTIDFDDDFDKTLTDLVKNTSAGTKAEVIRRAVASYSYLKKQQQQNEDVKVSITDKDNHVIKEIVLP